MGTVVRLLAVCALGVSGLYALRSATPPRHPARVLAVHAATNDATPDSAITTSAITTSSEDRPLDVQEVGSEEFVSKVIKVEAIHVEPIRLNPLQAYDEAPAPKPKRVMDHRRRVHHRHWHRIKRHRG